MTDRSAACTVAALYVETGGVYFGLSGVDPWDEQRDARLYAGPYPGGSYRRTTMREATVEFTRTIHVKFDVDDLLAEFPREWAEAKEEGCTEDEFVSETVAEIGLDLLDYNEWVIPEPMYDDVETDVRVRNAVS